MKTTMHNRMYEEKHGENLNRIFNASLDPITLSKKLFRLEQKAHDLALNYCNGTGGIDSENWDTHTKKVLDAVDKVIHFRDLNVPVYVNADARGYALKINDEYMRAHNVELHKDWGGYGILAPDFREEG